jgi:AraC-like DNA-binding protein
MLGGDARQVLYDRAVGATRGETWTRAWKPGVAGIREVFHARFADHAYPLHTHDVWTLFIVDHGAIRYDLHGRPRAAGRSMTYLLPPHVAHDGRAAVSDGFVNRVVYVETSALGEELIGPAVDQPMLLDARMRDRVAALNDALVYPDDELEAETRFAFITERIANLLASGTAPAADPGAPEPAEELQAWLDAHLFDHVTLAEAGLAIGASPTQLTRAFSKRFGLPPHAYVTGRRLEAARDRILRGQPLADVAAEVGFTDQAHLTRRFRDFLATTPGAFRQGLAPA